MTFDVVNNPPDAVISWLRVTFVLASPSKPTAVTLALVPRVAEERVEDRRLRRADAGQVRADRKARFGRLCRDGGATHRCCSRRRRSEEPFASP